MIARSITVSTTSLIGGRVLRIASLKHNRKECGEQRQMNESFPPTPHGRDKTVEETNGQA
jgi:hypothetical protein